MTDDDDTEDEEAEDESESAGPQDLKHDNGKWYASQWLAIVAVIVFVACGLCYKFGYDNGKKDGATDTTREKTPCQTDPNDSARQAPATTDPAPVPPMDLDCESSVFGSTLRCKAISLPPGEKLVTVTMRSPTDPPAVLTRPMSPDETPTEYVLHLPSEYGGERTYKVTETARKP